MARLARLYAPGVTQLIVASFAPHIESSAALDNSVFDDVQKWLAQAAHLHHVAIHGWALNNTRIRLLATPSDASGAGQLMQAIGRNLASRLNLGKVFVGRYKSCLLQNGLWVLPALIWIEGMPHSSEFAQEPESWPWSSAKTHTGLQPSLWLSPHPDYWNCGNTPFDRQAVYRLMLHSGNRADQNKAIEAAIAGQWALGDRQFLDSLRDTANRRAHALPRGRPKKS